MKSYRILISAVLISYQAKFSPLFITNKGKINDVVNNDKLVSAATTKQAVSVGYFIRLMAYNHTVNVKCLASQGVFNNSIL